MQHMSTDRRTPSRRCRGGGRRWTDAPVDPAVIPTCPTCRTADMALLAGEAEGGWWFVCLACDHLWDQRQLAGPAGIRPLVRAD